MAGPLARLSLRRCSTSSSRRSTARGAVPHTLTSASSLAPLIGSTSATGAAGPSSIRRGVDLQPARGSGGASSIGAGLLAGGAVDPPARLRRTGDLGIEPGVAVDVGGARADRRPRPRVGSREPPRDRRHLRVGHDRRPCARPRAGSDPDGPEVAASPGWKGRGPSMPNLPGATLRHRRRCTGAPRRPHLRRLWRAVHRPQPIPERRLKPGRRSARAAGGATGRVTRL